MGSPSQPISTGDYSKKKTDSGPDTLKRVTTLFIKKYKSIRNKVRNETRKLQMEEQRLVASHCEENPKIFLKYVNSKRKTCDHIGDLITDDKYGNVSKACTNSQKAEVLGNFFASVFVRETHYDPPNSQLRPCQSSFSDLYLVNKLYLIN